MDDLEEYTDEQGNLRRGKRGARSPYDTLVKKGGDGAAKSDSAVKSGLGYKREGGKAVTLEMTPEEKTGGLAGAAAYHKRKRKAQEQEAAKDALSK